MRKFGSKYFKLIQLLWVRRRVKSMYLLKEIRLIFYKLPCDFHFFFFCDFHLQETNEIVAIKKFKDSEGKSSEVNTSEFYIDAAPPV